MERRPKLVAGRVELVRSISIAAREYATGEPKREGKGMAKMAHANDATRQGRLPR